jgi:ribonuclease HI
MPTFNPYAIYVNCDGAMDYDSRNSGGVGLVITFPDFVSLEPLQLSRGIYVGGNIEMLVLEALITAMHQVIDVYRKHGELLTDVQKVIFITDRFGLKEDTRTSPSLIAQWRKNGWKSFEGKPIKNHKLLDELDKTRIKLSKISRARISIEYRGRKANKAADKLAKAAKRGGTIISKLEKPGEKIGKRKFDGPEIKYDAFRNEMSVHVNVFRKDPLHEGYEVWAEICAGDYKGCKLKIYSDDVLAKKLQRGNEYVIKLKAVFRFHLEIYRTLKKPTGSPNDVQSSAKAEPLSS